MITFVPGSNLGSNLGSKLKSGFQVDETHLGGSDTDIAMHQHRGTMFDPPGEVYLPGNWISKIVGFKPRFEPGFEPRFEPGFEIEKSL